VTLFVAYPVVSLSATYIDHGRANKNEINKKACYNSSDESGEAVEEVTYGTSAERSEHGT
jgi:hypothetical protein